MRNGPFRRALLVEQAPVLIAGVSGTLGRVIAQKLTDSGWKVRGISRGSGEFGHIDTLRQALPGVVIDQGDLCVRAVAAAACRDVRAVVAAAGRSGVAPSFADAGGDLVGNAMPWLNLLETCPQGTHLVLLSSQLVYGPPDGQHFREDSPVQPASPYALHRVLLEEYGRIFAARRGLRVTVLRLANVFGDVITIEADRTHGVVARMLTDLLHEGAARLYGDGLQMVELLHADDLARAIELVLRRGGQMGAHAIYNVSAPPLSIRAIAEALRRGLGQGSIVYERWATGLRGALAGDIRLDDTRFRTQYGWSPRRDASAELVALGERWRRQDVCTPPGTAPGWVCPEFG